MFLVLHGLLLGTSLLLQRGLILPNGAMSDKNLSVASQGIALLLDKIHNVHTCVIVCE